MAGLVLALAGCTPGHQPAPSAAGPAGTASADATVDLTVETPAGFAGWIDNPRTPGLGLASISAKAARKPNTLVGPGYSVTVSEVYSAPELALGTEDRDALKTAPGTHLPGLSRAAEGAAGVTTMRAGAGREFVVTRMARATDDDLLATPSSLRIADRTTVELGELSLPIVLIAAVPRGARVLLVTGDPGHEQSIDLRTGRRATAIPSLYTAPITQEIQGFDPDRYSWVRAGGKLYTAWLTRATVTRVPWDTSAGYPPPGRAWLLVTAQYVLSGQIRSDAEIVPSLDHARTYQVTGGGSTTRPERTGLSKLTPVREVGIVEDQVVMPVDEDFRKGTLRLSLTGRLSVDAGKDVTFSVIESKGMSMSLDLR